MLRHKNQVNFDPDTKTKYFSTPIKENQVNTDPDSEIKSISISHTEIKSISTTRTKTKSSSMLAPKSSDFRPAYKSQVTFDYPQNFFNRSIPTPKQAIFGPTTKIKWTSITTLKTKPISIHKLKPRYFRPAHKIGVDFGPCTKQVKFDPDAKTKSISIPYIESKSTSTPSLRSSLFRSPL